MHNRATTMDSLSQSKADRNSVTLQVSMATSSPDDSVPSTPLGPSPSFRNSDTSLSSTQDEPRNFLDVAGKRNFSVDSSSSSATSSSGPRSNCCSPSRSPSSPQGPRFKLLHEGLVHVCRLNHTRTVISKLLSSRFLRRWEGHYIIMEDSYITSRNPGGFMEDPIPYRNIHDIYPVARWDSCGRFCIRIVIPDGSLLLQVSNSYMREQWLHSLLWKRSIFRFKKVLCSCTRPEILLKELKNLVDLVITTPLQDDAVFKSSLDIISDVLIKGQTWMSRMIAEEVITVVAVLLERTTPTSEICDFFCWHCRENPRSTVVLDICTPIVQRILKHNMDFGKHPQTRVFVQEYLLAVKCQNRGDSIIKSFVESVHGPGSTCPHPRVLHNMVAICVAAIYTIFESRRKAFLDEVNEARSSLEASTYLEWETKVDCFASIFVILDTQNNSVTDKYGLKYSNHHLMIVFNDDVFQSSFDDWRPSSAELLQPIPFHDEASFDDWRPSLAELLQPIPFHDDALACSRFTSQLKEVVRTFVEDDRCGVHQMLLGVRDEKEGWLNNYCPGNIACDDDGDLWSAMLGKLLFCCYRRRKFLQSLTKNLGPCMLRALRDDDVCQQALCAMLEMDVVDSRDLKLQLITTLQSTVNGKKYYALLCDKQMHLRQLQQKGGPKKLALPSKSTDADVARLLNSGSFGDLECLSLAFTQVTSACAEEIIKLTSLRYLNLWSTQFGDSGLRLLSEHLPNLQVLNLCETRVTDVGLSALTAMKSLRKLNLNSTSLTPETFEGLKRTLPVLQECDVRYTDAWGF